MSNLTLKHDLPPSSDLVIENNNSIEKNIMKIKFVLLLLLLPTFTFISFSQNNSTEELHYEVNVVYPYLSMTKEKLQRGPNFS